MLVLGKFVLEPDPCLSVFDMHSILIVLVLYFNFYVISI